LRLVDVVAAAAELAEGNEAPARGLLTESLLDDVLIAGEPAEVGRALAERVRPLNATSVGFAIIGEQPADILERIASAAQSFRAAME
jgi:hypothetical protein